MATLHNNGNSEEVTTLVPVGYTEQDEESSFNLTEVLGSGLFGRELLRKNWRYLMFLVILTMIYVSNRYSADQEKILIHDLHKELEDVRFRALTNSSELTRRCRQSNIEAALHKAGDSTLVMAKEPAFVIYK